MNGDQVRPERSLDHRFVVLKIVHASEHMTDHADIDAAHTNIRPVSPHVTPHLRISILVADRPHDHLQSAEPAHFAESRGELQVGDQRAVAQNIFIIGLQVDLALALRVKHQ
ncbi:hypothetical protein [Cohnella ginsengisoli]|uniref:hypothetical protein n=1 Tax=Cohnella ginsengisoli TaxID=425004 RepID=UPI003B8A8109